MWPWWKKCIDVDIVLDAKHGVLTDVGMTAFKARACDEVCHAIEEILGGQVLEKGDEIRIRYRAKFRLPWPSKASTKI